MTPVCREPREEDGAEAAPARPEGAESAERAADDGAPPASATPLLDTVRSLSFPRFAGTDGEARAAEIVADRFARAGLAAAEEPFRASTGAIRSYKTLLYGVGPFFFLAFAGTALVDPLAGALVAIAFLAFIRGVSRWSPRIERAFDAEPAIESRNVVARRPGPASGGRSGVAPRIVVLAHIDSKSARWSTFVSTVMLSIAVAGIVALGVWCALAAAGVAPRPTAAGVAPIAALVIAALVPGLFNTAGDASPGAMDNASGVAVLLASAESLPSEPALAGSDLTFIATGAEEIGLAGAMRWIQAHERECPQGLTVFINIDSVGVGRTLLAMNVSGEAPGGWGMAELVRVAAERAGVVLRFAPGVLGIGVDTMPIAARGFATVTVLGEVLGAASRRFHSPRDTPGHLNEEALRSATRLVREIAIAAAGGMAPSRAAEPAPVRGFATA